MSNPILRPICTPTTFSLCASGGPTLMFIGSIMPNRGGFETGMRGVLLFISTLMLTAALNYLSQKTRELEQNRPEPVPPPAPSSVS